MSKTKKIIIIIWLILVGIVCFYVPWKLEIQGHLINQLGYSPIWSPLKGGYQDSNVDTQRVILEFIIVSVVCGIVFLIADLTQKK